MAVIPAQEREDRTLLSSEQMSAIINEASGERAMHHVLELVPYQFVRPPSEYQGHFRESEVMARLAKEYGFSNVTIEDYPTRPDLAADRRRAVDDGAREPRSSTTSTTSRNRVASTNANGDITGDLVERRRRARRRTSRART